MCPKINMVTTPVHILKHIPINSCFMKNKIYRLYSSLSFGTLSVRKSCLLCYFKKAFKIASWNFIWISSNIRLLAEHKSRRSYYINFRIKLSWTMLVTKPCPFCMTPKWTNTCASVETQILFYNEFSDWFDVLLENLSQTSVSAKNVECSMISTGQRH